MEMVLLSTFPKIASKTKPSSKSEISLLNHGFPKWQQWNIWYISFLSFTKTDSCFLNILLYVAFVRLLFSQTKLTCVSIAFVPKLTLQKVFKDRLSSSNVEDVKGFLVSSYLLCIDIYAHHGQLLLQNPKSCLLYV